MMIIHTFKELPLLPTTQPKPVVSSSLLEVYFEERYRVRMFGFRARCPIGAALRQPHSCKRRTIYFFCCTHHVYSQRGQNFVLVVSVVAPFCGRFFSSSHAHDFFLVSFSHGSRPRRRSCTQQVEGMDLPHHVHIRSSPARLCGPLEGIHISSADAD